MDTDALKRQLGLRLKELRLAKGLKQEDLADYGFSYRYYGKIERGIVNVTLETLARLCEIFEVSLSDLFVFIETGVEVTEDREAVAVKVGQLLKRKGKAKIRKLRVFIDEIL
jgi:transcriptional regulator with XRE-family HTH domain